MEAWIAIILAVLAWFPGLYATWRGARKADADTAEKYQNIADKAADNIAELQAQVRTLQNELNALRTEKDLQIQKLEIENAQLRKELDQAKLEINRLKKGTGSLG